MGKIAEKLQVDGGPGSFEWTLLDLIEFSRVSGWWKHNLTHQQDLSAQVHKFLTIKVLDNVSLCCCLSLVLICYRIPFIYLVELFVSVYLQMK